MAHDTRWLGERGERSKAGAGELALISGVGARGVRYEFWCGSEGNGVNRRRRKLRRLVVDGREKGRNKEADRW